MTYLQSTCILTGIMYITHTHARARARAQTAANALGKWPDDVDSFPAQSDYGGNDSGLSPSVHTVGSWNKLLRVHSHLHRLLANPLSGKAGKEAAAAAAAAVPSGADADMISSQWLRQVGR